MTLAYSTSPTPLSRLGGVDVCSPEGGTIYAAGEGRILFWGDNEPAAADYPAPGALWCDTTNAVLKYNAGTLASPSWTTTASAAAQSLDGAYNNDTGERTVTVDAGSIVFDCSDSSNDYALVINNTSTSAAIAKMLTIDSEGANSTITTGIHFATTGTSAVITTAIDASDAGIITALAFGAAKLTGTYFTVSEVGATVCVGLNYGAGSLVGTGDIAINTAKFTVAGATGNTLVAGTLEVTGACTFSSTLNGTFTGTWASTTWTAATITMTPAATTGDGVTVTGDSVTTGNIVKLHCDASLTSGCFISCVDVTSEVFAVFADGSVTIAGTASGTDAIAITAGDITLTAGDCTLSDGDLTLTGGKITVAPEAVSSNALAITGSGSRTAALVTITDTPATAGVTLDINVTPASACAQVIDIDVAGTDDADILCMNFAGAYTGSALKFDMTTAVAATAIELVGAGTRTVALVSITDTPATAGTTMDINITPAAGCTQAIDIDVSGTDDCDVLCINFAAAYTGSAIVVDMTTAVAGTAAEFTGAGTRTVSLVSITDTPEGAGAHTLDINVTPATGTTQVIDIDVAGTDDADILCINFAAAYTGSAVVLDMTTAVAGTALEIVGAGTRVVSLVSITDTPGTAGTALDLNVTPSAGCTTGAIDIDVAGTDDADVVSIDFAAAYTGDAIGITMANAAVTAQAIVIDSNVAATVAQVSLASTGFVGASGVGMVTLSNTGALVHANASCLLIAYSGAGAASGLGTSLRITDTGSEATAYAVYISAGTGEALYVGTGTSYFAEEVAIAAGAKLNLDGVGGNSYVYETGGVLTLQSDGSIQLNPANKGNGSVIIGDLTVAGESELHIKGDDDSDNDPGFLVLYDHTGADYYLWVDNTGDLRIHSAKPADQGVDGAVVGAQS